MKREISSAHASDYVASLAAGGRYHFTSAEARRALGVSADAAKLALYRLARRKEIAQPARGFYVVLPPEYRSLGCLPADQFVPALMHHLKLPYYAGLLSAAQYHGAAHHRPQEFQVMLDRPRRATRCGRVRVAYILRKRLAEVAVQPFNSPRGSLLVSTAEATAIDLVGYQARAGGLDQVATILSELAERLDPEKLVEAARTAPISWAQRLGYLLDRVGAGAKAVELKRHVKGTARQAVQLLPSASRDRGQRDPDWKVLANVAVEPEA